MRICEIFRSIQGEGTRAGEPCTFVRLAGCNLDCAWCDTQYARTPEGEEVEDITVDDLLDLIAELHTKFVCITGGEPLLQKETPLLVHRLCESGYTVAVETNGSLDISRLPAAAVRIMDIKPPSSGMYKEMRWENLRELESNDEVKIVIAGRADYDWAAEILSRERLTERCTVLMGAVHGQLSPTELAEWILSDGLDVRLQLQLHKQLWPDTARGV